MTKTYYVYIHAKPNTTDVSGIFYVGKGNKRRTSEVARKTNNHHCNIIKKYGKENIIIRKMACDSEQHAFELEISMIAILRRMGVELVNLTDGGEGVSGWERTDEWKAKISASRKKYRATEETKIKISKSMLGKKHTEETRAKISLSHKGITQSAESIAKIIVSKTGTKLSDEHKLKIGAASKGNAYRKGKKCSEETKVKMSASGKLKPPVSDETKKKLSLANIGKKRNPESVKKTNSANIGGIHSIESRNRMSASQKGKKMSVESIEKTINATRKYYIVTNPLGESIEIHGLNRFCRENRLHATIMGLVAQKKLDNFKGWKCEYLLEGKAALTQVNAA